MGYKHYQQTLKQKPHQQRPVMESCAPSTYQDDIDPNRTAEQNNSLFPSLLALVVDYTTLMLDKISG